MSTVRVGDRITIVEGDGADPYSAEILDIETGPGGARLHVHALLPIKATVELQPGVRITPEPAA